MRLLVQGVNHRVAPLEVRERFHVAEDGLEPWLKRIRGGRSGGGVILSTCNRTEFYVTAENLEDATSGLGALVSDLGPADEWQRHRFELEGDRAIAHMFRVASGMDSAILGEGQILGQFKVAFVAAQQAGSLEPTLDYLMRRSITTAKRVRTETRLGRNPVGFGHAAASQAGAIFGSLRGRSALIVGAGKMAGSTARVLASEGLARMTFANRNPARALELAGEMPAGVVAVSVPFSHLEEVAAEVDLVITSTSAPDHVFTRSAIEELMRRREGREIYLLDLSVPRDVDPAAAELPGVHLNNVDDMSDTIDRGLMERMRELPAAEAIIGEEVLRTLEELGRRRSSGQIRELLAEVEELRQEQLAALAGQLDAGQLEKVDQATRRFAARLLHGPLSTIHRDPEGILAVSELEQLIEDDNEVEAG